MKPFQHVLCPIDFSDSSRHAFDRAVAIARTDDAALTALHVVPLQTAATILPYMGPESLGSFELPQVDLDVVKRDFLKFLAVDRLEAAARFTCDVTEAPDVPREILEHAVRLHADLIVMGTHGRSGFQRIVLGSVAEKVMRRAAAPVLLVPPHLSDAPPAGAVPFQRVLCAIDFSDGSLLALQHAAPLAERHAARLGLLHVIELAPPIYDPLVGPPTNLADSQTTAEQVIRERLAGIFPPSLPKPPEVDYLVVAGRAHRAIVKMAEEWHSDLIVLGIHGRNAVDRLLFGSTVEPVVRHAPCPVLTVRANAHTATAAA